MKKNAPGIGRLLSFWPETERHTKAVKAEEFGKLFHTLSTEKLCSWSSAILTKKKKHSNLMFDFPTHLMMGTKLTNEIWEYVVFPKLRFHLFCEKHFTVILVRY